MATTVASGCAQMSSAYMSGLCFATDFLGRTEIKIADILRETKETKGPITKKLVLHEVESGEVLVKLDIQLFHDTWWHLPLCQTNSIDQCAVTAVSFTEGFPCGNIISH